MGKCYGQSFFCNFSFIKCYLCIVLEQAYGDAPVRQAAFTLKMVFFPGFPDNCKVGVRDPFLVRGILLVYKMFVWKKLYRFTAGIFFAEDFIDQGEDQLPAVI